MNTFFLENGTLCLEFNRANGALVGLSAVPTGWKILDRPQLGLSFRLLVPLSDEKRNNPVFGEKQPLSRLEIGRDNRSAVFYWDEVTSEYGGKLPIRLVLSVSLDDKRAIFSMSVENQSDFVVENVYCPYLGDIQHPGDEKWFKTFSHNYGTAVEWNLWPHYDNLRGYFGVDYPTQFSPRLEGCGAPMAPFFLLRGEKQGLYAGVASPSCELVAWHTELRPGYGSSIDSRPPEELTISGKETATRFAAVHVPFIQPGETRRLTPVALEAYQGDWHHGVDIYKRWRNTWYTYPSLPAWAKEPHTWQQIHINSPEDELRLRFTELPKIGEDCARQGVKAIQLVGWNDGGQDQGNPSHDPDPRLGTWEELKEAIAKIQAMGVKLILFSKFTWADRATAWFRSELARMAIKDPYGDYYHYGGYQYQTATQLLDINTKRLIPMCFLDQEYLDVCAREFKKTVDLGADGILFDECQHHTPALLCFDMGHGHRYGAPVYANDRQLICNFGQVTAAEHPDFLFAGEACYDWELEAYHLAYFRSESKEHVPLSRYLQPHAQFMTAVTGFNDRNMVNQCLMYRYIISYEPYNFKGQLDDFPLTLQYGQKMDALRSDLRDYFWDGEFRDTVGAEVSCAGKPHHPYSVFLNAKNGKSGLVICNYNEHDPITVTASLENGQVFERYRLVDAPGWQPASQGIDIPPQSAAVVI
ncbi:MAG: DUF6259 domain-containing protein [Anaerolineaceae bacterium]